VIPSFNASMVLPPFVGDSPGLPAMMSPYKNTIASFVKRFATSAERTVLLKGLLSYREALRGAGIIDGFQWIDGSFVEDVERLRKRAPADIDLVTFASRPAAVDGPDVMEWLASHGPLFDQEFTKKNFYCDAYFVDLRKDGILIVDETRYWFGLFSHQRETSLWKGMIELPMNSDDAQALDFLDNLQFDAVGGPNA
jgi:hypothetical protein